MLTDYDWSLGRFSLLWSANILLCLGSFFFYVSYLTSYFSLLLKRRKASVYSVWSNFAFNEDISSWCCKVSHDQEPLPHWRPVPPVWSHNPISSPQEGYTSCILSFSTGPAGTLPPRLSMTVGFSTRIIFPRIINSICLFITQPNLHPILEWYWLFSRIFHKRTNTEILGRLENMLHE